MRFKERLVYATTTEIEGIAEAYRSELLHERFAWTPTLLADTNKWTWLKRYGRLVSFDIHLDGGGSDYLNVKIETMSAEQLLALEVAHKLTA